MDALYEQYARGVLLYVAEPDEEARENAYALGRSAIVKGLGVLDVAQMHTAALTSHAEVATAGGRAWQFFSEVLAPFEMALRGFREANESLKRFAGTLEERVATRTAELLEAQQSLREQTDVLHSVLDSMSDGVAVLDAGGCVRLVNPAARRVIGVDTVAAGPAEWSARCGFLLPDERTPMPATEIPIIRALAGEDVRDAELFVRNAVIPDGAHLSVSASPLRTDSGVTRGGVLVFRDVTARRRAEEAAKKAEERLVRAQKLDAIGQLAGGVAHDFNNLLAVIATYASLLLGDLEPDDPRAADVREIAKAAKSAASLTRQLLAFSRQQVLQPSPLDLNEVVTDVARMLERTIGEHIELGTSLAPALGLVLADRGQVEQVLMNLAVNARDAMPNGGKLMIETHNIDLQEVVGPRSSIVPGPHSLLSVTDSGTGMDEATKARIFDPFFTTKELGRGTGLGLATVYGIVQQSGGHISVYTEVGKGSSFKIYLPRVGGAVKRAMEQSAPPAADASGTILLVEDDESLRRVASRVLRSCGYEVLEACQPSEALSISASHDGRIDAMVTDVVMPGMTGPDLAAALAHTRRDMRVLFTSGYSAAGIVHGGTLPLGASFIEKPFAADSLREKVREVLARRRSE